VGRENSLGTVFHGLLFSWLAEAETAYRSRQGFAVDLNRMAKEVSTCNREFVGEALEPAYSIR
jgi:hypothetical protein